MTDDVQRPDAGLNNALLLSYPEHSHSQCDSRDLTCRATTDVSVPYRHSVGNNIALRELPKPSPYVPLLDTQSDVPKTVGPLTPCVSVFGQPSPYPDRTEFCPPLTEDDEDDTFKHQQQHDDDDACGDGDKYSPSFFGHAILSFVVFILCGLVFGLAGLILAGFARKHRHDNVQFSRRLGRASAAVSVAGIAVGIVVILTAALGTRRSASLGPPCDVNDYAIDGRCFNYRTRAVVSREHCQAIFPGVTYYDRVHKHCYYNCSGYLVAGLCFKHRSPDYPTESICRSSFVETTHYDGSYCYYNCSGYTVRDVCFTVRLSNVTSVEGCFGVFKSPVFFDGRHYCYYNHSPTACATHEFYADGHCFDNRTTGISSAEACGRLSPGKTHYDGTYCFFNYVRQACSGYQYRYHIGGGCFNDKTSGYIGFDACSMTFGKYGDTFYTSGLCYYDSRQRCSPVAFDVSGTCFGFRSRDLYDSSAATCARAHDGLTHYDGTFCYYNSTSYCAGNFMVGGECYQHRRIGYRMKDCSESVEGPSFYDNTYCYFGASSQRCYWNQFSSGGDCFIYRSVGDISNRTIGAAFFDGNYTYYNRSSSLCLPHQYFADNSCFNQAAESCPPSYLGVTFHDGNLCYYGHRSPCPGYAYRAGESCFNYRTSRYADLMSCGLAYPDDGHYDGSYCYYNTTRLCSEMALSANGSCFQFTMADMYKPSDKTCADAHEGSTHFDGTFCYYNSSSYCAPWYAVTGNCFRFLNYTTSWEECSNVLVLYHYRITWGRRYFDAKALDEMSSTSPYENIYDSSRWRRLDYFNYVSFRCDCYVGLTSSRCSNYPFAAGGECFSYRTPECSGNGSECCSALTRSRHYFDGFYCYTMDRPSPCAGFGYSVAGRCYNHRNLATDGRASCESSLDGGSYFDGTFCYFNTNRMCSVTSLYANGTCFQFVTYERSSTNCVRAHSGPAYFNGTHCYYNSSTYCRSRSVIAAGNCYYYLSESASSNGSACAAHDISGATYYNGTHCYYGYMDEQARCRCFQYAVGGDCFTNRTNEFRDADSCSASSSGRTYHDGRHCYYSPADCPRKEYYADGRCFKGCSEHAYKGPCGADLSRTWTFRDGWLCFYGESKLPCHGYRYRVGRNCFNSRVDGAVTNASECSAVFHGTTFHNGSYCYYDTIRRCVWPGFFMNGSCYDFKESGSCDGVCGPQENCPRHFDGENCYYNSSYVTTTTERYRGFHYE